MRRRREGFTLVEMMLVLAILAIATAFSAPRFAVLRERRNLDSARQRIASAVATARAAAIQKGRPARFSVTGNRIQVTVTVNDAGTQSVVIPAMPLDSLYGVRLELGSGADAQIDFDSRGLAVPPRAATAIYRVRGSSRSDSVCVSTVGQLLPRGCSL